MKVRIVFQELVSYETTIDFEPTGELAEKVGEHAAAGDPLDVVVEDILSEACEDGEPLWFHMLEKQDKDWVTMRVAGVDERYLTAVHIED